MAELTLSQIYRYATGNVKTDMDAVVENIKNADEETKKQIIGRILYSLPGGVAGAYWGNMFRTKFYAAIEAEGVLLTADTDNDGDIEQDDFDTVKENEIDVNGDGVFDKQDLEVVKAMSTAKIVADEEIDDEPEE